MNAYYGYIRVSTVRQGEHGVSLEQQRQAIQGYADKHGLQLTQWFEERETAAKRGRPVFGQMLKLLRSGKARGAIIHKIDRSARNLRDWADLGEMIDAGIEVHFANEALDLHSRGGRLSADIQAVVAADYIRNLREETRKGFYGRLKQGLYPLKAVVGYLNQGGGKPKLPDPAKAPLVRLLFEKYATGRYNLDRLVDEMYQLGLRNLRGKRVNQTSMSVILNNRFYAGVIRIRRTGESFAGVHQPLISTALFERVQRFLRGKTNRRPGNRSHLHRFRQMISCKRCGYSLIGECQKGHVYYRCHTKACPTRTIREEVLEQAFVRELLKLEFSQEEKEYFRGKIRAMKQDWIDQRQQTIQTLQLRLKQLEDRQNRLTDAYLDQALDKDTFQERKAALLSERCSISESLGTLNDNSANLPDRVSEFLELAGTAYLAYRVALGEEKRDLLNALTSNPTVDIKTPMFMLRSPFAEVSRRFENSNGGPRRDTARIWDELIPKLLESLPAADLPLHTVTR